LGNLWFTYWIQNKMRKWLLIFLTAVTITSGYAQSAKFRKKANRLFLTSSFEKTEQILQSASAEALQNGKKETFIWFQLLLGENYQRNGYMVESEKAFSVALQESRKLLPVTGNHYYLDLKVTQRTIFDAFDKMAYFYLAIGNIRKAEELFNESKSLRDGYFARNNVHRALPLAGLGSVAFRNKEYETANNYFSQALVILKKSPTTGYNFDLVYRLIYNDLVEICLATNRISEAQNYLGLLALSSYSVATYGSLAAKNAETARIFDVYARNALIKGDYKKAQQYLDRGRDFISTNQLGSLINFKIELTQGRLYWVKNDFTKAAETFKSVMKNYSQFIASNFALLSEYEKEKFYYTLKEDLEIFNAFVLDCHKKNLATSLNLYEAVYDNQLNMKALLLGSINKRKNIIINSGDPELIGLQFELEQARARLSGSYYTKDVGGQIETLTKEVERIDKELNRRINFIQSPSITWQQVNSAAPEGETAIEIVRVSNIDPTIGRAKDNKISYLLLMNLHNEKLTGFSIHGGEELETRYARFHRNSIVAQTEDDRSYDAFWEPIRKHLKSSKRIYISPDGIYSQINLSVLKNPRTGKFLVDETDIVYLTNTSDILKQEKISSEQTAFLLGRPSYAASISSSGKEALRAIQNTELMSLKEQKFADLPGTEQEILIAASTLTKSGWSVTNYIGDQATEHNLKAAKNPGILHISTHGFFIGDTTGAINPMIRSGLLLAGVSNKNSDQNQDGILTAYEAALLNLQKTKLVVLSACETGLGEVRNGEGVYGLQRAITSAGAQNLLMSLWKVDDLATSELMQVFYQRWTPQTNIRDAFRQAQLEVRKKYPHPFYWGAFIMLGN